MKLCWVTIHVTDMEKSKRFYCELLGLKIKREFSPRPGFSICFLEGGGADYELIADASARDQVIFSNSVSVGFLVDSLGEKMADLRSKGVENIIGPIAPSPNDRFIFIKDPDGMTVQIVEHK